MLSTSFGTGLIWAVPIGIGWLLAALCLVRKYDPEKKICTVSDFVKLTFSGLTLWLVGSIYFSLSISPTRYETLVAQLAPLSDVNPDGSLTAPSDPDRLRAYEATVENWLSPVWFSTPELDSAPALVIVGTPDVPMGALCFIEFASDFNSNLRGGTGTLNRRISETPVRYVARCSSGESG